MVTPSHLRPFGCYVNAPFSTQSQNEGRCYHQRNSSDVKRNALDIVDEAIALVKGNEDEEEISWIFELHQW